jgi:hypothetical protein
MTEENMTIFAKKDPSDAAKELLSSALSDLMKATQAQAGDTPRLFFPGGIELISITVDVLSKVKLVFKVAGAEGISGLLSSEEIEAEHTDKINKEVVAQ